MEEIKIPQIKYHMIRMSKIFQIEFAIDPYNNFIFCKAERTIGLDFEESAEIQIIPVFFT